LALKAPFYLNLVLAGLIIGNINSAHATNLEIVLPIAKVTPGAINAAVSQENIQSTICVKGFTKGIRPPVRYTGALKAEQLRGSYARYKNLNNKDFEEDHLISLELGGDPVSELNLWPEPYNVSGGAYLKDKVENKLHFLVCSGKITLKEAQEAISSNWFLAYKKYM
jgi:hypothetical protein